MIQETKNSLGNESQATQASNTDFSTEGFEHILQLYDTDESLLKSVAVFIAGGLAAGDAALVIATLPHREAFAEKLRQNGIDVALLQQRRQLILLDAEETLAKFMVKGAPDPVLFRETISPLVDEIGQSWPGVKAFGEMVALLQAQGNSTAAIALEELWNKLGQMSNFSLLCAYPISAFGPADNIHYLEDVCTRHSRIMPLHGLKSNLGRNPRSGMVAGFQHRAAALEEEILLRKHTERRLRETQSRLETELADSALLQRLSGELISEQDINALYQKVVSAAVAIMRSDFASMQMFHPERGALRLLASHGFSEAAQKCWEWVSHETASSCGEVLRSGQRVIATDVRECRFLIELGGLQAYLTAGIYAMQSTPLRSRSGKLVGMISTHWNKPHQPSERDLRLFDILARQAADLIERTRAEEILRESQERFRNLFDSIDQGFCTIEVLFNPEGRAVDYRFILVNPAFERQTGIPNPTGRTMREIAPMHEEHWFETYGAIALTGQARRFENHAAQLGRYYEVYAWRIGKPEERKVGILFNDITHRRQAEETERRLIAIVEHSEDAIISIDLNAVITTWNHGAERLYGFTSGEAIGQPVSILIPYDRENEEPRILQRIRRGETVEHYETVRRRKNGTTVAISLTVSPLKDSTGRIVGASKVARDITEKVRAREILERTVAERTAQLRDTVAELEAFSYSIAHDMRAPLRAMNGYARVLQEDFGGLLPQQGREFLRRIASGSGRLDNLITDVLDYSKLARGEMPLEKVDLEKLIREIVESYPELHQSRASIRVEGPIQAVNGNRAALTQCFSNLLSNAVKFVPAGRTPFVRISSETRGDRVRVSCHDNGIGISVEGQNRIFRMFQRLNPAAEFEGTGIGLTIVRKAVERMGGSVGVDSELGVGSTFWIELRRAD